MRSINYSLAWNPRFEISNTQSNDVIFIGDGEQYLLSSDIYHDINEIININGKLYDYVFGHNDISEQVQRIRRIDNLLNDNILTNDDDTFHFYTVPNFSIPYEIINCESISIYVMSTLLDADMLKEWVLRSFVDKTLDIVVVDDYLDPRILQVNKTLSHQEKDWILIKPTGKKPMIGPVFYASHTDSPCFHCLHTRLVQNNPVREWLRRRTGKLEHQPVPIFHDKKSIKNSLYNFEINYIKSLHPNEAQSSSVYSIDINNQDKVNNELHHVSKRPQCPFCGDPDLYTKINNTPLTLEIRSCHDDVDGGYRSISRDETLANLVKSISPVCGVISELKEITNTSTPGSMSIYQSAYYQNTYQYMSINVDTFVQLSLGKGISTTQAKSSAVGEAFERQAAQFTGEEPVVFATVDKLEYRAFNPHELTPFSQAQYEYFQNNVINHKNNPQWVSRYNSETPIHWTLGWSLTNSDYVYFPAAFCFANTPFDDHKYSLYTHNGNSAGNNNEEAILQGALEVIERDAVAIWWYNQIPRPGIDINIIPENKRKVISNTLDDTWDYWLLDISHDLNKIYTTVAVGQHKSTSEFSLGFGCHIDITIACQRALTEMFQLITIKNDVTGPFDFKQISPHPFLYPHRKSPIKTISDFLKPSSRNIAHSIEQVVNSLNDIEMEMCVVNYTRPDISLKTLKVIIPGMCHFWPQLANKRLYEVPVKLGWLSNPLKEGELNSLDLYL